MSKQRYAELYRDWANNFLTVDGFASHYGFDRETAERIIDYGKVCHEAGF